MLSSSAVLNRGIETWVRRESHILGGEACVAFQFFLFISSISFMDTHYPYGKEDIVRAYSFAMFGMALLVRGSELVDYWNFSCRYICWISVQEWGW